MTDSVRILLWLTMAYQRNNENKFGFHRLVGKIICLHGEDKWKKSHGDYGTKEDYGILSTICSPWAKRQC